MALIREQPFHASGTSEAGMTNHMTHLLAKICNACWAPQPGGVSKAKLRELHAELEEWKACLPASFEPWASYNVPEQTFAVLKYLRTWHVIAWQYYYAAIRYILGPYLS
jgi:hypothetical protein